MYTGFCILSILWKQKEENIDVHVYWVLYSQYSLEAERRKHRCTCTCILGSVFSVFSENREEENIDVHVHVYWVLYSQYSSGNRKKKT